MANMRALSLAKTVGVEQRKLFPFSLWYTCAGPATPKLSRWDGVRQESDSTESGRRGQKAKAHQGWQERNQSSNI